LHTVLETVRQRGQHAVKHLDAKEIGSPAHRLQKKL
jgi:hypothetical protein